MTQTQPRIVLASHNRKKLVELREVLQPTLKVRAQQIVSSAEVGVGDPVEDGVSFADNALIKARAAAEASGLVAIADDSGLCVDILGGSPGIFSARWSGTHGDDAANNALLLAQLRDVAAQHRGAAFVCAAAAVIPAAWSTSGERVEIIKHGRMPGSLLREARGEGGFGYDPLFIPNGYSRTSAELSSEEKNAISHRGQAFRALAHALADVLAI